ncbi:hypothetical protein [Oryzobacter telluris]|uniref:hypothetical protein n=1 Tax=Oryzobacter telluris TaxID=3149179 RepID=UPI00370DB680
MSGHISTMTVECRTCPVRELHCGDCMVPVLLELTAPSRRTDTALDPEERAAVTRLVHAGLVDVEEAARARVRLDLGAAVPASEGGRAVG